MKITLHYKSDKEYYTKNDSDNRVEIDMYDPAQKKAQSPMELLLSGLIACAAVDIAQMVKKRRKTLVDLSGIAEGERREDQPRKYTSINIHYTITSPDLQQEEASRLIHLAVEKYCSVAASLNDDIKLTHSYEIVK